MHRKLICLGLLLALLLSGCSATQEAEQEEPTETISAAEETPAESTEPVETEIVETETPEVSVEPVEEESEELGELPTAPYCQFFWGGETSQADLDGDGTLETISLAVTEDGGNGDVTSTLTVNDATASIFQENPTDVYCLVDICGDGSVQLIGVQDYGPSDDYVVNLYRYDGESGTIVWLDEIAGLFSEPFYNGIQATCTGDGNIQTYLRLDLFQTWYALVTWNYANGSLTMDRPEVYEAYDALDGLGINVTTLCDLVAFSDRSTGSESRILPAGTELRLLGTDNEEWVEFEVQGSEMVLWFHVIDGYFIQGDLAGGKLLPEETLGNLCTYD